MTGRQLTCAACGIESWAVETRIVEREPTPDDPTQYRAEPRCVNTEACQDRVSPETRDAGSEEPLP